MKLWLSKTQLAAHAFWAMRDVRERKMLLAAAAVIFAALSYLIMLAPALAGREKLKQNLPPLREQVAQLQALSSEASSLNTQTVSSSVAAMTQTSLNNTLSAHGLKTQSVNVSGEIAQLQLSSVSFSATLAWLDELQKTARISVTDAKITALAQPDQVDASFTLRQNGNP